MLTNDIINFEQLGPDCDILFQARNIACCIEIKDSDEDGAVPLKVSFKLIIMIPLGWMGRKTSTQINNLIRDLAVYL